MEQACTEEQRTKFLLLTGAPRCKDLFWTEIDLTVELQPPFLQAENHYPEHPSSAHSFPSWRELHLYPRYLHTGFSQCHYPVFLHGAHDLENENDPRRNAASTLADAPSNCSGEQALIAKESLITDSLSLSAIESFWSTSTVPSQCLDPSLKYIRITDLSRIPAAHELNVPPRQGSNLVNLLVLILTVPQSQTVQIRSSDVKKQADLIRLFVADEESTTFEISIWLNCVDKTTTETTDQSDDTASPLRKMVGSLQKHDIVLVQNVALRVFQNKVGATSIRGLTEIKLLYRDYPTITKHKRPRYGIGIPNKSTAGDGILEKITKILAWRDAFLDTSVATNMGSKRRKLEPNNHLAEATRTTVQLPIDTQ